MGAEFSRINPLYVGQAPAVRLGYLDGTYDTFTSEAPQCWSRCCSRRCNVLANPIPDLVRAMVCPQCLRQARMVCNSDTNSIMMVFSARGLVLSGLGV